MPVKTGIQSPSFFKNLDSGIVKNWIPEQVGMPEKRDGVGTCPSCHTGENRYPGSLFSGFWLGVSAKQASNERRRRKTILDSGFRRNDGEEKQNLDFVPEFLRGWLQPE